VDVGGVLREIVKFLYSSVDLCAELRATLWLNFTTK
jgi:hypothetical protein